MEIKYISFFTRGIEELFSIIFHSPFFSINHFRPNRKKVIPWSMIPRFRSPHDDRARECCPLSVLSLCFPRPRKLQALPLVATDRSEREEISLCVSLVKIYDANGPRARARRSQESPLWILIRLHFLVSLITELNKSPVGRQGGKFSGFSQLPSGNRDRKAHEAIQPPQPNSI